MKTSFASVCLSVISHIKTFFYFIYFFILLLFLSCIGFGKNWHLLQSEVNAWLFQCGELFDKNKLQAAAVSSTEKSPWFSHSHSWMFLGLPKRDGSDKGPGDEAGLHQCTNTALHSRPCVQLVEMTREGSGLYWVLLRVLCFSQRQALVKLRLQCSRNKTWPVQHRTLGWCWLSL